MWLTSDSAACRNLRGRIPTTGTMCVTKHHISDSWGGFTHDCEEVVTMKEDDRLTWMQRASQLADRERWLHSSAGCPPPWRDHTERQQSELCHHPATKTHKRIKFLAAGGIKTSGLYPWVKKTAAYLAHYLPLTHFEVWGDSIPYHTQHYKSCDTHHCALQHTFVWNSVEAPNSKRSFTMSWCPCWEAKKRAVEPVWKDWWKKKNTDWRLPQWTLP